MYTVYIQNYLNSAGNIVSGETLLYSVPITDSTNALTDPIVKTEMGKTGSFEFSLMPAHPFYDCWRQMQTIMRVDYDGTTLFRGRVLTIDNSPLSGEKKIHLEGDLAFLMDSVQPPTKEEKRSEITILAYLQQIVQNHNDQMDEGDDPYHLSAAKKMMLGEVPGQYSNRVNAEQQVSVKSPFKFGTTSWGNSMSALEALMKENGGYFRTRYENGVCYLDWLDYCFQYEINGQPIEIGQNLIELTATSEVNNIFTALIPMGRSEGEDITIEGYRTDIHGNNKRILVPQIVGLFSDSDLNRGYHNKIDYENAIKQYGVIYKTQQFQNADSQEKLWEYATQFIRDNYVGGLAGFSLSALDMHHVNGSVTKYLVGDRVQIIYPDMFRHVDGSTPTISKVLTLTSIQYNLYSPERNQYNAGIPNSILNKTYGVSKSGGGGGASEAVAGGGGGGGGGGNADENVYLSAEEVDQLAWNYILNDKFNGKRYAELQQTVTDPQHVDAAVQLTHLALFNGISSGSGSPETSGHTKKAVQTLLLDGIDGMISVSNPPYGPYKEDPYNLDNLTDEQITAINKYFRSVTIDGMKQEIGVHATLDTLAPDTADMTKNRMLAKIGIDNRTGVFKAYGSDKVDNENAKEKASLNGSGFVGAVAGKFGKNGAGDAVTTIIDGANAFIGMTTSGNAGSDISSKTTTEIRGETGSMDIRRPNATGWQIQLNELKSYTDGTNVVHTDVEGFIAAHDVQIMADASGTPCESLATKMLVVNALLADYAKIGTLEAMNATITNIKSTYVTTTYLSSNYLRTDNLFTTIANASNVNVKALTFASASSSQGGVSCNSVSTNSLTLGGRTMTNCITGASVSSDGTTLTLTRLAGDNVTFKKGDTDAAYKQGWNDCRSAALATEFSCLTGYRTYNNGAKAKLYSSPVNGALVTGDEQVWRYSGTVGTAYKLPAAK